MSYSVRRDEPNELEIQGLNLIVKTLNKKYPFIIGWEFKDNNPLKYTTMLILHLIIDVNKLSEYVNEPLYARLKPEESWSLCAPLDIDDFETCRKIHDKIYKNLNKLHKYLPLKYKIHTYMIDQDTNELVDDFIGDVSIDLYEYKFVY